MIKKKNKSDGDAFFFFLNRIQIHGEILKAVYIRIHLQPPSGKKKNFWQRIKHPGT